MRELYEIKEKYRKLLHALYSGVDFEPRIHYSLIVEDKLGRISYGGEFIGARRKIFVSDVDGVLNREGTPSLFETYLRNHSNKMVRENCESLCEIGRKIGKATRKGNMFEIEKSVKELEDVIKSCKVSLKEHLLSSLTAAKKLKLAKNLIESFYEIKGVNYKIILNSGSPQECLEFLARIKSLPVDLVFGSRWYFKDEKFYGILPNLASNKVEIMRRALAEDLDLFKDSVFITDDLEADRDVSLAVGMVVKFGSRSSEEFSIPLKIECREMRKVVNAIRKWEISNIHYFIRDPRVELKILEKIKNLRNSLKNLEKETFLKNLEEFTELALFGYQKDSIRRKVLRIKSCKEREKIKNLMDKILIEIGNYEPLVKALEYAEIKEFERELRQIVKKMENLGAIEWKEILSM